MGEAWRRCRVARGQSPTSSMGTEGVGRTPPAEGCRSYRVCLAHRGTRASFLPAGPLEFGVWQLCLLSKRSQRKSFRRGRIEGRLAEGGGCQLGTHFVASSMFFLEWRSLGSVCCLFRYSETALAGNSVSQMYPKSRAK